MRNFFAIVTTDSLKGNSYYFESPFPILFNIYPWGFILPETVSWRSLAWSRTNSYSLVCVVRLFFPPDDSLYILVMIDLPALLPSVSTLLLLSSFTLWYALPLSSALILPILTLGLTHSVIFYHQMVNDNCILGYFNILIGDNMLVKRKIYMFI